MSDFLTDVLPYMEKNYRVIAERNSRAMAGLSMGGNRTLQIAMPPLDKFAYVGGFSSGLLGGGRGAAPAAAAGAAPTAPPPTVWRGVRRTLRHHARRRGVTQGPQGLLVRDRQGRRLDHDDAIDGRVVRERGFSPVSRNGRRPHVAQLARLPDRVRADDVPVVKTA